MFVVLIFWKVIFACHGLAQTWNSRQSSLPYLGLFGVGIGSGAFHASLKLYAQLGMDGGFGLLTTCLGGCFY